VSISFPYEHKIIDEDKIIDPRIILEVKTNFGFLKIKFLIDSGADVTTIPLHPYAELFNFKRKSKDKVIIGGIEGRGIAGFPYSMIARLQDKQFKLRCYFIDSKIDPLLGRLDFWHLYSICFDNQALKTIIQPLE